jgi:hypothetical protein
MGLPKSIAQPDFLRLDVFSQKSRFWQPRDFKKRSLPMLLPAHAILAASEMIKDS